MTLAEGQSMRVTPIVGLAFALLITGCSSVKAPPPPAAEAVAPLTAPAPPPSPPQPTIAAQAAPAVEPVKPMKAAPPAAATQSVAKADATGAKTPAKVAAPKASAAPKKENAGPQVAKKASPTLDLKSLEERLKDTEAIGVLTKIALKNQVDDLLDQFRAYYQGKLKTTLAELRQPYDRLVLKVLSLLQDSDPALASAIAASREAIWGILADPAKFATVS
jgi:hypothetical protein